MSVCPICGRVLGVVFVTVTFTNANGRDAVVKDLHVGCLERLDSLERWNE